MNKENNNREPRFHLGDLVMVNFGRRYGFSFRIAGIQNCGRGPEYHIPDLLPGAYFPEAELIPAGTAPEWNDEFAKEPKFQVGDELEVDDFQVRKDPRLSMLQYDFMGRITRKVTVKDIRLTPAGVEYLVGFSPLDTFWLAENCLIGPKKETVNFLFKEGDRVLDKASGRPGVVIATKGIVDGNPKYEVNFTGYWQEVVSEMLLLKWDKAPLYAVGDRVLLYGSSESFTSFDGSADEKEAKITDIRVGGSARELLYMVKPVDSERVYWLKEDEIKKKVSGVQISGQEEAKNGPQFGVGDVLIPTSQYAIFTGKVCRVLKVDVSGDEPNYLVCDASRGGYGRSWVPESMLRAQTVWEMQWNTKKTRRNRF